MKPKIDTQQTAIDVIGDKRAKSTYILSIEIFQSQQTVIEIETDPSIDTPDPFENQFELVIKSESIDPPQVESLPLLTPQPPTAPQSTATQSPTPKPPYRQASASIVALIAILLFGTAFLLLKIGVNSVTWVIAAGVPVLAAWWRYLVPSPTVPKQPVYITAPV